MNPVRKMYRLCTYQGYSHYIGYLGIQLVITYHVGTPLLFNISELNT